jgi:hypothetical protein
MSLCRRHGWDQSHAGSIFWMAQMMEAWFHADKGALQKFDGNRFEENALAKNPKVEEIPKKDLEDGLRAATKNTTKGNYFDNKTSHGRSPPSSLSRWARRRPTAASYLMRSRAPGVENSQAMGPRYL